MKNRFLAIFAFLFISGMLLATNVFATENYKIPTAVTPPVIDGTIAADEWKTALKVDVSNSKLIWPAAQSEGMNIGDGSYVLFMWDKDNLYCAANILDATYGTQPASGGALNSGDGVQLCFYSSSAANNGDGATNMFWDFLPRTGTGDASTAETYEHFTFAATTNLTIKSTVNPNGNYTMEWVIPWSQFAAAGDKGYGTVYKGEAGTSIILEIAIMDHDGQSTQALGASTDEWCVAATTDVYTLTADQAGIIPVPAETEAPATGTPAAGSTPAAPQTFDAVTGVSAIALAAAAIALYTKKKK